MRRSAIAILLALPLLALPLLAQAAPVLVPTVPEVTIEPLGADSAAFVCTPGNPYAANAAGYYNFYNFTESYAVLVNPADCPTCDLGFAFTRVRTLLRLNAGATFSISAAVADVIDAGNGCYAPGAVQAVSGVATVSGIATAGGYYINLGWASPCIDPGRPYFLILNLLEPGALVVGPYVDNDGATPCRAWHSLGAGWVDLATAFVGDVFLWAESDCCATPVSTEGASWGGVKSLFR